MKNTLKIMALAGVIGLAGLPASAQLSLGLGTQADVDLGVSARVETRSGPYVHDGYESGYWHPHGDLHRRHRWYARYEGYDCYQAFQYTYEHGQRVRYESTFCYDERDRPREVRSTRVIVRLD
jgi:hypothetical protein